MIKTEENEVETDRNEVLNKCVNFYTELYSSPLQNQHPSQRNTSPDTLEIPLIMTSEVKKTLKEMKNRKPPGHR